MSLDTNQIDKNLIDEGIERAVLTSLMTDPSKMVEAATKLKTEDFTNDSNKYLYSIMLSLYNNKSGRVNGYDISTLLSLAKEKGKEEDFIEKSGGRGYIEYLELIKSSHISLENFTDYINRITTLSTKRKLYETAEQFKREIVESSLLSPEELMVKEQGKLDSLLVSSSSNGIDFVNLGSKVGDYVSEALQNKKEILGIRTNYPTLDKYLEGLKRKNLIILSAFKKTGKSAFLMNIGVNVGVTQKIPTLMISTEMSDDEIAFRAISRLSQVNEVKIKKGYLNGEEHRYVIGAQKEFAAGNFYHIYMPMFTLDRLIATIRKFHNNIVKTKPDGTKEDCLIIFDYIKMPSVDTSSSQQLKEYKLLGQIADGLKMIAGILDIPVLTACQVNRGGDVANSFELTWFCNTFMTLKKKTTAEIRREQQMSGSITGNQILKITDNRGGEECFDGIDFEFNGPVLSYTEIGLHKDGTEQN